MKIIIKILCIAILLTPIKVIASIDADELWLRESIPGQANGAGFGAIYNHGETDMLLLGGSVAIADDIEIHRHVHSDGQMRMERMEALVIPAGKSVKLQPGGYHLMLMNLSRPLATDEEHEVTLYFSDGSSEVVTVKVRDLVESAGH